MSRQLYNPAIQAMSDSAGNIVFTFPPPAASNLAWQGTLSIASGAAGTFSAASASGIPWGTWSASAPYGPITQPANDALIVTGAGLQPNTFYTASFVGVADEPTNLDDTRAPSPIGSSGLFGVDGIIDVMGSTLAAAGTDTYGSFPCINFAAMRLAMEVTDGGPLLLLVAWQDQPLDFIMANRIYTLGENDGAGFKCQVCVPHLGDALTVQVLNNSGAPATYTLVATHATQPLAVWGGFDLYNAQAVSIPDSTPTTLLAPAYIFGGPATLSFNPSGASSAYTMRLQSQDDTGAWNDFETRTDADGGRQQIDVYLPAAPVRVEVEQTTGSAQDMTATLELDLHRVG